jgi:hypothetical protein
LSCRYCNEIAIARQFGCLIITSNQFTGQPIKEELVILTKTYPPPIATYRETTCVAAINRQSDDKKPDHNGQQDLFAQD